jgi:hypothetical protein
MFPFTSWNHYLHGNSHYSKNRHQSCIPFQVSPTKCTRSLQQHYQGKSTSTFKTFHDYNTSLLVKTWPPTNIMFYLLHVVKLMLLLLFINTNSMITHSFSTNYDLSNIHLLPKTASKRFTPCFTCTPPSPKS